MQAGTGAPRTAAVLCSHNVHKAEELDELLPQLALTPLSPDIPLPEETGTTFEENARIKALAGAGAQAGTWAVADDSGLCVDALDGAPGVRSARFAGEQATDHDNTMRLLDLLRRCTTPQERRARFVCVLVAISPAGHELVAEGTVEGHIAHEPAGEHGFGYDPVFVPHGFDQTFAQLGPQIKHVLSHRARAASALSQQLEEQLVR